MSELDILYLCSTNLQNNRSKKNAHDHPTSNNNRRNSHRNNPSHNNVPNNCKTKHPPHKKRSIHTLETTQTKSKLPMQQNAASHKKSWKNNYRIQMPMRLPLRPKKPNTSTKSKFSNASIQIN